jgi:peptidoglycan/xylan/chitin deacetylase (PgdA/CDA1 family)
LVTKDKTLALIPLAIITISLVIASCEIIPIVTRNAKSPIVVIRIDDIQDYAFRDAQLYLLNYNIANNVPACIAIIPKEFGSDKVLVDTVESALHFGSEAAVHGWEHEDLAQFSLEEQETRLQMGKLYLKAILGVDAAVLAPPTLSYDEDTTVAMRFEGYKIITGLSELQSEGLISNGILSIPATVELSDYANATWKIKSFEKLKREVSSSILTHGYAAILTHPQEFISNNTLNQTTIEVYESILQYLKTRYSFSTFEKLESEVLHFAP